MIDPKEDSFVFVLCASMAWSAAIFAWLRFSGLTSAIEGPVVDGFAAIRYYLAVAVWAGGLVFMWRSWRPRLQHWLAKIA